MIWSKEKHISKPLNAFMIMVKNAVSVAPKSFEFQTIGTGNISASLDLGPLSMKQAADYHFQMSGIVLKNNSSSRIYVIFELKLFRNAQTTCPLTGWVFDGLDRTPTKSSLLAPVATVTMFEAGEALTNSLDFYQPAISGIHTACLYVHAAWTEADVRAEVETINSGEKG